MAARSADAPSAAVTAIDTDCNAIQSAIQALHPVHLAMIGSKWEVLSDAGYTLAERTHVLASE